MALDQDTLNILKLPPLAAQMPIVFEDTDFRLESMEGDCARCGQPITDDNFRARITRPFPFVAVIEARGICRDCSLVTSYRFRVRQDGTFDQICGSEWRRGRFRFESPGWRRWLRALRARLGRLLKRLT